MNYEPSRWKDRGENSGERVPRHGGTQIRAVLVGMHD